MAAASAAVVSAGNIQFDQRPPGPQQHSERDDQQADRNQQFHAQGLAHALHVALAVILGTNNARPGQRTPDAQVEHKQQLIDDGNGAHGQGAHLANHHIIQQADHVGQGVLHNNRQNHHRNMAVKGAVTDQALPQG